MGPFKTFCTVPLLLISIFILSCSKSEKKNPPNSFIGRRTLVVDSEGGEKAAPSISVDLLSKVVKHDLFHYPSLNVLLIPKGDVQTLILKIKEKGGELIYDPNLGNGSDIHFVVMKLTPEIINDKEFIDSLKLKAADIDMPVVTKEEKKSYFPLRKNRNEASIRRIDPTLGLTSNIPTKDVGLDELRKAFPTDSLGKDITVAVIDTGIDAGHEAFKDANGNSRVAYWEDLTEETKSLLSKVEVKNSEVSLEGVKGAGEKKSLKLPERYKDAKEVYITIMDEEGMVSQLNETNRQEGQHLDINNNGQPDKFLVVLIPSEVKVLGASGAEVSLGFEALIDLNGDLKLDEKEQKITLIDYNIFQKIAPKDRKAYQGFVNFPGRKVKATFPFLIETKENIPQNVQIGIDFEGHGTHVAGIIGSSHSSFEGSVPAAKFMSLKVCSGITCTGAAITKALVKAFYNPSGLVPDVVNISLGSHEKYQESVFAAIISDLSAKFGTVFFISASNSGPGYRSINHFGNTGSVVMVGAHASCETLKAQYRLFVDCTKVEAQNLLFFSSVGPSYTGEMKPNIVAPGAAISSTPRIKKGVEQLNGTSMSSPLATGATAAMLSVAKSQMATNPDFKRVFEAREKKIEQVLGHGEKTEYSLNPLAFAIRDALQESAKPLKGLTKAQQGYGLIQIDAALAQFSLKAAQLFKAGIGDQYFDLRINDRIKPSYERTGLPNGKQRFSLSLQEDGERSQMADEEIKAGKLTIQLDNVEKQCALGKAEVLGKASGFYSLVTPGTALNKSLETTLQLANGRNLFFDSFRDVSKMEEGCTYLGHYKVMYKGTNVFNILDVFHKPLKLDRQKVGIDVPYIDPFFGKRSSTIVRSKTEIGAYQAHHYHFLVEQGDYYIDINAGIDPALKGKVIVYLYDPTGKEVGESILSRIEGDTAPKLSSITVPVEKKLGVWELTVATYSFDNLTPTTYDLVISSVRMGISESKVDLLMPLALGPQSTPAKNKTKFTPEKTVVVNHNGPDVRPTDISLKNFTVMESLFPFPIKSGHWSYKKLKFPNYTDGDKSDVTVEVSSDHPNGNFSGRVDHNLYTFKDGKFEIAYKAVTDPKKSTKSKKFFKSVKRPEEVLSPEKPEGKIDTATGEVKKAAPNKAGPITNLYAALETYNNFGEDDEEEASSDKGALTELGVDVTYHDFMIKDSQQLPKVEKVASTTDSTVLKIVAPVSLPKAPRHENTPEATLRGELILKSNFEGVEETIPVTLYQ